MFQAVFLLNNLYLYCHFVVISKLKQLHNSSAIKPSEVWHSPLKKWRFFQDDPFLYGEDSFCRGELLNFRGVQV